MSSKVKSTGRMLTMEGFRSDARELDHKRIKYDRLKAPKGVEITDAMMDAALEKVQRHPDVQNARLTQSGAIIVTPKRVHCARKAIKLVEQLKHEAFRLIVNAMIAVSRNAKRKLRQAAAAQRKEKAEGFLNDKTRTIPGPVPAS